MLRPCSSSPSSLPSRRSGCSTYPSQAHHARYTSKSQIPSASKPNTHNRKSSQKHHKRQSDYHNAHSASRDSHRGALRGVFSCRNPTTRGGHRGRSHRPYVRPDLPLSTVRAPWMIAVDIPSCTSIYELFHQEIITFEEWISPTPAEKEVRNFIIEAIVKALKVIYPRATVSAFGSTETGLYLPSGDIDLVLDLTFMPADSDFKLCLRQLAQNLEDLGLAAPGSIEVIERAQVPIVKFKSVYGLVPIDLSLNQSNGIAGASFFRQFLFDGPNNQLRLMTDEGTLAFRSLVLILKILLESRGLEQVFSGGLSSYSVMCLVLSHLQLNPLARQGRHSSKTFLAALLLELLDLYGTRLDFNRVSVSVEDGGRLQDQKMRSRGQLMDASIVVEDPVNHVNNIARGCFQLEHVKALFNETYATLESALHLKGSILNSRREGTSFMLREEYDSEDLSILSHGLRLPQSLLDARQRLQEVHKLLKKESKILVTG